MAPAPGTPFFLFAAWPPRWIRYDVVENVVAYLPFGFFVALASARQRGFGRLSGAVALGALLAFAMESLQMFLPTRVASLADFLSNTAGAALGATLALALAGALGGRAAIGSLRDRWFLPGPIGDFGLALLAIWLVAQVNPGIALFATMFDAAPPPGAGGASPDLAATVVEGAHSALQLLGVALFLALLLRERRYAGGAALLLVGAAAIVKGIGATLLLKPAAWENWLPPGVSLGVAAGSLLLTMAIWLPRPAQVALAAIALLSSLLSTLLAPELLYARAPLAMFNWTYGQLLNFNGLTHAILLVWPAVASVFLFGLAGKPGWGEAS